VADRIIDDRGRREAMDIGPLVRVLLVRLSSEPVPEVIPSVETPQPERIGPRDEPVPAGR
jgi:hypothetical protein